MAEVIEVQIIADDSQIVGALNNIGAQAEELSGTMSNVGAGVSGALDSGAIDDTAESMAGLGNVSKKTSGSMSRFTRGAGRAGSALARVSGVGGRATSSLASLGVMMANTPFGPLALAAAAAAAAIHFFGKSAANEKKNIKDLNDKINDLNADILASELELKFAKIDVSQATERQKAQERLLLLKKQEQTIQNKIDEDAADAQGKLAALQVAASFKKNQMTETDYLNLEEAEKNLQKIILEGSVEINKIQKQQLNEQNKINKIDQDAKKAAAALMRSLIRDEVKAKIEALKIESAAREAQAQEVFKDATKRDNFIKNNAKVLGQDIQKIKDAAASAEIEAQKMLTAQLIINDEQRAIFEAKLAGEARAKQLEAAFKDDNILKQKLTDNETKLQNEITQIQNEFAEKRKNQDKADNDEELAKELLFIEAKQRLELAKLEENQEILRQGKANEELTDEEITEFKQKQADERLKIELDFQKQKLEAIRATNKLITAEESAALDAEIKALEARINGVGVTIGKAADKNKSEGKTLGDLMGMSPEAQKNSKAVQQAMEQVTAEIQKAVAARVAALQKEVDFRNKRISEIQNDLANEIELNKLGKASNIKEVQDRLKAEKAARDKAEAEKKKAAEAQFIIDTAMQTSNLITAISSIYASTAGIPAVGVALATALSAVMIGAFIAGKAQAASSVGFAEGGYTGDAIGGGKYERAGHVHRGEFVVNKETTERLGLQGASMSDFDGIMKNNYGGPSARSMARKNKQINGHISDNIRQQRAEMVQAYNDGVKAALTGQNSILKDILKATENTPVVFPLEGNRFLIQRGKNKTEIKKIKR